MYIKFSYKRLFLDYLFFSTDLVLILLPIPYLFCSGFVVYSVSAKIIPLLLYLFSLFTNILEHLFSHTKFKIILSSLSLSFKRKLCSCNYNGIIVIYIFLRINNFMLVHLSIQDCGIFFHLFGLCFVTLSKISFPHMDVPFLLTISWYFCSLFYE